MNDKKHSFFDLKNILIILLILIAIASNGYFWWERQTTTEAFNAERTNLEKQLAIKTELAEKLSKDLNMTADELSNTEAILKSEQARNDAMHAQVEKLAGTVGDLDKLAKLDKELLEKYSKVYFLNENYIPAKLSEIADEWKYSEDKTLWLHSQVMPFFRSMIKDAKDDGVDLWVVSGFRSFETQADLKDGYTVTYGTGANAFSADQGYSEHQLGTTVDFTTSGINGGLSGFGETKAFEWLQKNAYKYGFILSYPEGNSYYVYEPWHWRFVGRDLARDLHNDDANFYDWDQRKIDEYLLNIFD